MNKIFYTICVGSLALAVSALGAEENAVVKKGRGAGKGTVQSSNPVVQARVYRNSGNGARFQQRSVKTTHTNLNATNQSRFHSTNVSVARQRNLNQTRLRHPTASNNTRVFDANHNRSVKVDRAHRFHEKSRTVNVQRRLNRHVTVTNNWHNGRFSGQHYAAFRNYHREHHDRNWWRRHYSRIVFVGGGWYYWNAGFWYPAWGYDSAYYYPYDGPIYGYNNLNPYQVVVNVQAQLQREGYYSGPVDGVLGPMTRQAIADFQADHGLAVTSAVDEPTLDSLGLA